MASPRKLCLDSWASLGLCGCEAAKLSPVQVEYLVGTWSR